MAMTMEPTALEPKIKAAMESIESIGLGERANDLLDMLDEIVMSVAVLEKPKIKAKAKEAYAEVERLEKDDAVYNADTLEAMQEARDIMAGKTEAKRYKTAAEMHADILAENDG